MINLTLTKEELHLLKLALQELEKKGGRIPAVSDLFYKLEQLHLKEQTTLTGQNLRLKKAMNKEEFIETFAHFMTEHDLNEAYDRHFPNLGHYNEFEIKAWLREILEVSENPNPPLKFEELKVGMWVWDNLPRFQGWCKVIEIHEDDKIVKLDSLYGYLYLDGVDIENRLYRKEVK